MQIDFKTALYELRVNLQFSNHLFSLRLFKRDFRTRGEGGAEQFRRTNEIYGKACRDTEEGCNVSTMHPCLQLQLQATVLDPGPVNKKDCNFRGEKFHIML